MRLVIGITGCSGVTYGLKLVEACKNLDLETDLIVSSTAEKIIDMETGIDMEKLRDGATRSYKNDEMGAEIASGSVKTSGMTIIPCSMKTLGSIANGVSDNLITRAADVTLKEERKLVLVPRETPINQIGLKNMVKLSEAGATILPAAPGFYHSPESVEDLVNFVVGRVLDQFEIEHQLYKSWTGEKK